MLTFFKRLTTSPVFEGDDEKTRAAELLNIILNALIVVIALALTGLALGQTARPVIYFIVAVFLFLLIAMKVPASLGYIKQVSIIIVILITIILTLVLAIGGSTRAPAIVFYILASVISGLLISRRAIYWSVTINALVFSALSWAEATGHLPVPDYTITLQQPIVFMAASFLTAVLLNLALKRQQEALEQFQRSEKVLASINAELELRVNDRTSELVAANQQIQSRAKQLQIVAEVARTAASIQDLNQLLNSLTHLISRQFGYYHVGIFLMDEQNQYAILEAANTEGGLTMLKRGHRLKVGEQGIVGFVTSRGEARIALDIGSDAVFFDNPDLPNTRSELALPLKISEKIIGALDLQSTEEGAFSEEDVSVLSILADQVAIAIQNARSSEQAQRSLQEAAIATKQLSGEAWKGYAKTVQTKGYRYDGVKSDALMDVAASQNQNDALSIPVQLRGQTIGHLRLKASDGTRKWSEDERAIAESTAERVALAMEGARLLEEAQKRATRETFLSEIGTKLGASFQLDSILRDTVEELGQTLKGSTISFQLVNPLSNSTKSVETQGDRNE
ncbi:MAG: GAF domain-containing protein [Chloroflexota bacterium]